MYLADRDIQDVLPELAITTDHDKHAFDADAQIQPCSIDLRLSNVFWKPLRHRRLRRRLLPSGDEVVDLRQSHIRELDPRRDWKRVVLSEGDALTLKPGQIVMGRIYERFEMPATCAGKIEGRSSYARLGLFVHCSGDFINPGWGGFMPLQLFNASPHSIRVTPYLPICQLKLVRLSSEPSRVYGQEDLESKYVNDDGGPSFWWRDRQVKALQKRLGQIHLSERIQREIVERVRFEDPEPLDRLQSFVNSRQLGKIESADELLDQFARREDKRRWFDRAAMAAGPVMASASIGSVFVGPIRTVHVLVWLLATVLLVFAVRAVSRNMSDYLGRRELRQAQKERETRPDGRS